MTEPFLCYGAEDADGFFCGVCGRDAGAVGDFAAAGYTILTFRNRADYLAWNERVKWGSATGTAADEVLRRSTEPRKS